MSTASLWEKIVPRNSFVPSRRYRYVVRFIYWLRRRPPAVSTSPGIGRRWTPPEERTIVGALPRDRRRMQKDGFLARRQKSNPK